MTEDVQMTPQNEAEIAADLALGQKITKSLMTFIAELSAEEGRAAIGVTYAVWTDLLLILLASGWTEEQLARDLALYAAERVTAEETKQ